MRSYFEFAGNTLSLLTTFVIVVLTLFLVFPNLPVPGELLDVKSGYSYEEAIVLLDAYGTEGRTIYLWISLVLDTLFPMIYVTFFAGMIYRFRISEGTWWFAYIPVFGGIWDILENVQISLMLIGYPDISAIQVAWASTFTQYKHWIGSIYLLLAVTLFLLSVARSIFAKFRSSRNSD